MKPAKNISQKTNLKFSKENQINWENFGEIGNQGYLCRFNMWIYQKPK